MFSLLDINNDGIADSKDLALFESYQLSSIENSSYTDRITSVVAHVPLEKAISIFKGEINDSSGMLSPDEFELSMDQSEILCTEHSSCRNAILYSSGRYIRMPVLVRFEEDSTEQGVLYRNISLSMPKRPVYKDVVFVEFEPWSVLSVKKGLLCECKGRYKLRSKRIKGKP